MTDLDPEIWDNPTLGAAAPNKRLDVIERQETEDYAAKIEGREPRTLVADNNYPGYVQPVSERTGTVPSNAQVVHFEDEQQADVPVDSGPVDNTAGGIEEGEEDSTEEVEDSPQEGIIESSESPESDSTEEGNTTSWT